MANLRRFLDPEEWKRLRTPPEIPPQDRPASLPEFLQSQETKKAKGNIHKSHLFFNFVILSFFMVLVP